MKNIRELLINILNNDELILMVFGSLRKKSSECKKVNIRPVLIQDQFMFQVESFIDNKAYHENLSKDLCIEKSIYLIENNFKQVNIFSVSNDFQILASKPDNAKIIRKPATKLKGETTHNRKKAYLIPSDEPCDFLIELGVMDKSGHVIQKHYSKFRQINRFLEIVSDVIESVPVNGRIIDFGCGKAYLTFALYYYINIKLNKNIEIIGLDLKSDVIDFCNKIAKNLNYKNLFFKLGDIAEFTEVNKTDMVVTLHACDTATDFALIKAVKWDANVILSVPCCQHELFPQLKDELHEKMFSNGILKERFSAILTDGLRGLKLESKGYEVDMIEFTSLEHTSKNIMIRAVKTGKANPLSAKAYTDLKEYWGVRPSIDMLE